MFFYNMHGSTKRFVACALTMIMLVSVLSGCSLFGSKQEPGSTAGVTEEPKKELSVTDLLKAVLTLKDDLKEAIEDIKNDDPNGARTLLSGVNQKTDTIRQSLDATLEGLGDSLPSLTNQLSNIRDLLDLLDLASEKVLFPAIDQIQAYPSSKMREGDGLNTKWVANYIDFAEKLMPEIENLVNLAHSVDFSVVDSDGDLEAYLNKADSLLEMYHTDTAVFSRLKSMIGAEEDRLYVFAAQNSAEIRASGGFPGAVGTIRITDGVLEMGDFHKVYDVFADNTPRAANVTNQETNLFHGGLHAPRDADYCPDFERVAYIWALGYEARQHEPVDGVISMTPVMVQRLLSALDEEIKLFDGTIVNGDNAVVMLQHDLYFKYYGSEYIVGRHEISDQLFADAAKKTMEVVMDNLSVSNIAEYLSICGDAFDDRTLMLWMADEDEQAIIQKMGWNAGLNTDPMKPQAGVYYNCSLASKMGYFVVINTEMGEGNLNSDGSRTYPITVTITNDITEEDIRTAQHDLTGGRNGAIEGSMYFFAPAGGTVSDFTADNGSKIELDNYHDLDLGYMRIFSVRPNQVVTITYNVTTAPGAETPLVFSKTPTVQEYHIH